MAVVVPTLNEAGNIARLVTALDKALAGRRAEIIFVDDWSSDATPELVETLARRRADIRLIRRHGRRGLASAVLEGMMATTADVVAVIDADMQHDESLLPTLIELVASGEADVAVGTRYGGGGSVGDWDRTRARVSGLATDLAHRAMRLAGCGGCSLTDPMSGFFAVRRDRVVEALPAMTGRGFKILLDLLMSSPRPLRVREAPYVFRGRTAGESKLGAGVCLDYALLLATKTASRFAAARLAGFGAVGLAGLFLQLGLVRLLHANARLPFSLSQTLAVIACIGFNFFANNALTYRDRRLSGSRLMPGLASFYAVCGLGAIGNIAVAWLVYLATRQWWLAGVAGAVAGAAWNFGASSRHTWRAELS